LEVSLQKFKSESKKSKRAVQQNHRFKITTAVVSFIILNMHRRAVYSDKQRAVIRRPYLHLTYEQFYELPQQGNHFTIHW